MPKTTEILRELVEENALALVRPHFLVLGYDVVIEDGRPVLVQLENGGAKLYGTSKEGNVRVSDHDDLGAMVEAVEKLMNRVFGRPKQATEISGPEGGPVEMVEVPVTMERSRTVADILAGIGAARRGDDGA